MQTFRRLAHSPSWPPVLREWRAELLTVAVLAGGLVSMLSGH
jgi:hypothetical protein